MLGILVGRIILEEFVGQNIERCVLTNHFWKLVLFILELLIAPGSKVISYSRLWRPAAFIGRLPVLETWRDREVRRDILLER